MTLPVQNIYDYVQVGAPIAARPLTVDQVIEYLKLDTSLSGDAEFEAYINGLIDTAVSVGEKYTKKVFRESRFSGFLDWFYISRATYEIRKSPLKEIESITYVLNNASNTIDSGDYYVALNDDFSHVQPIVGKAWPLSVDDIMHPITFTFLAGYEAGSFPPDLLNALLAHIALMFSNRGDCNVTAQGGVVPAMPATSKLIYDQYRILDLRIGL